MARLRCGGFNKNIQPEHFSNTFGKLSHSGSQVKQIIGGHQFDGQRAFFETK